MASSECPVRVIKDYGAHIASLLITFFYRQMPQLIERGHSYLAVPPLYRLSHGGNTFYARNETHMLPTDKTLFIEPNVDTNRAQKTIHLSSDTSAL